MLQDTVSGLYDFMLREYHPNSSRWIQPDPIGIKAANPANPQTWNRYAYANGGPSNKVDVNGACTIFIGGVTDSANNSDFLAAANDLNGEYVSPYNGGSIAGGILQVLFQDALGANGGTQAVADMVNKYANDPSGIQIVAFSGGAQSFTTAVDAGLISSTALQNITQTVYLSPGVGLFSGAVPEGETFAFHGRREKDFGATFFARIFGNAGGSLATGHSFKDEYSALTSDVRAGLSHSCDSSNGPGTFNGSEGVSEWYFTDPLGNWMNAIIDASVGWPGDPTQLPTR
jgi:RHS repeat-associated protein